MIDPSQKIVFPISPNSNEISLLYSVRDGSKMSPELLNSCAQLFSAHYGIWGERAAEVSKYTKPGQRVKMNSTRLREQCVDNANPTQTLLVTCSADDELLGHAFASVWSYDGGTVGWVTQLVVDKCARRRGIATQLLQVLKRHPLFANITAIGVVSSNPATCHTVARYAGKDAGSIDLKFVCENASKIMDSTPIVYLKTTKLHGSLFEAGAAEGVVSSANTGFFVDHEEPMANLQTLQNRHFWCWGDLPEGREYLVVLPVHDR